MEVIKGEGLVEGEMNQNKQEMDNNEVEEGEEEKDENEVESSLIGNLMAMGDIQKELPSKEEWQTVIGKNKGLKSG